MAEGPGNRIAAYWWDVFQMQQELETKSRTEVTCSEPITHKAARQERSMSGSRSEVTGLGQMLAFKMKTSRLELLLELLLRVIT